VKRGVLILLVACPCASALNPSLDINQYAHKAWPIREGFLSNVISSIAQGPDGYLWLGTETGLFRFDGVRAVPWKAPGGERLAGSLVFRLLVAHDGTLWIGTHAGLASWNGVKLTWYRTLGEQDVRSLVEGRDGTVWVGSFGTPSGRLCAIRSGTTQCYGQDSALGRDVQALFQDDAGNLWVGAESGLWQWKPGPPRLYATPRSPRNLQIMDFNRTVDGQILTAASDGMKRLTRSGLEPYSIPGFSQVPDPRNVLGDRDGGLWIGTSNRGIFHVHQGRTDVFSQSNGLSGNNVHFLFEDREGNVWAATDGGLDRFREFAVSTVSVNQGLSSDSAWSVLASQDGSVWVGTRDGLNRWNDGRITTLGKANGLPDDPPQSLFEDDAGRIWLFTNRGLGYLKDGGFVQTKGIPGGQVHAIASDRAGALWLSEDRNLLRVNAGQVVEQIPWSRLGSDEDAIALMPSLEPGGLWLGFRTGLGVIYFKDGQIRQSYRAADGLGSGAVGGLKLDSDGALWAATAGGLSVIQRGHVTTLTAKNGLPCDSVQWIMDDDIGSTWLYLACGLARVNRAELNAWKTDPRRTIGPTLLDTSDGVTARAIVASGFSPRVTKSRDGKLWLLTGAGVRVVDPRHLPFNNLAPPVHIEEIIADHKAVSSVRLPALTRDLEIDYTALSFVAPEKVRFRVKLEGHDPDWKDAGNERKAFYNDLPPRHYRFRVMACNHSGVWNEAGDFLDFSIAPAYYQTTWFLLSCVGAFFALLWMLYRYRLYQIAEKFNAHLEGRVNERVRVARELHDTLLQGFQGLMLRLQVVDEMLPPGKAKQELEETLETGDQTIVEARNAVHDLRSATANMNDLAGALRALGQELATGHSANFRLVIEGPRRELHPIIRDEIYRIAREALRNAFAHSGAGHIEAEITFGERLFRLRIRDDGAGIPSEVLDGGRAGHFGLAGMRERAKQIGSQLTILSGPGVGTEIEFNVKGSIAYDETVRTPGWRLFRRKDRVSL
jgi:ligand-binding sensor domain-containing protein/signal transduction histidine kinase